LSTTGDILRHRRLPLFGHVARLDPRVPAHDALRLTVDIPTKAEWQWPAGEDPRNVQLSRVQEDANALLAAAIYTVEI